MAEDGMPEEPGSARQNEVYLDGLLDGETPDLPVAYEDLEAAAMAALEDGPYGYVAGGAGGGHAISHNREAFDGWRIVPRLPRDVSERDLGVSLFGRELPAPIAYAPVGVQSIVHDEGELATAEAAADLGLPMVLSSASSETIEDVGETLGETPGWFQLYWPADRDLAASFVERAERAGFDAVVVTVDTPMLAWREMDIEEAYLPFLEGEGVANYFSDPVFRDRLDVPPEEDEIAAVREFGDVFGNPALTYEDLDWLDARTDLPILVKGVLHPDDAEEAVAHGADGVIVSNHGRQVDRAVPALDALPGVADLDLTLGLCGHASVEGVDRDLLIRADEWP